jgi:hypothetical protein
LDEKRIATFANDSIVAQRLYNQRLIGTNFEDAVDVVKWLTAVQSQDFSGAKWALAQRLNKATDRDINQIFNDGKILRTHILRPTWHFVTPTDIRWMLKLTAPRVDAASAYAFRRLELDSKVFKRSNAVIAKALRGGKHLTRDELQKALETAGIQAEGVRLAYIVIRAELDALICSGPLRGKQFTYALLDERAPEGRTLTRDEALVELTTRYFDSHGPALLSDYSWWSGLTMAAVRSGIEMVGGRLNRETINGKTYWFGASEKIEKDTSARLLRPQEGNPTIHLLPNYDEYLVAYKDRGCFLDPEVAKGLRQNVLILSTHSITQNGNVIGAWRRTIGNQEVTISARFLKRLSESQQRSLRRAAERFARFLGFPRVRLSVAGAKSESIFTVKPG